MYLGVLNCQSVRSRRCSGILHFTVVTKNITANALLSCLVSKRRRETNLAEIAVITCPGIDEHQTLGNFLPPRENDAFQPLLLSFPSSLVVVVNEVVWQCSVSGQFYDDCPYLSPTNVHFQGI